MSFFLLAWFAAHAYIAWRAASLPPFRGRRARLLLAALAVTLSLAWIAGRVLDRVGPAWLARPVEIAGATWIGVALLALVCLLAVDVVTAFGLLFRRHVPRLRAGALGAAGLLSAFALVQGLRPPAVVSYEVSIPGLPAERDGTVVVLVSDLHVGSILGKGWLEARLAEIASLRPDLVAVCGDVFEGDSPREAELAASFRRLSAPLGVFAVTGNHELHGSGPGRAGLLEQAGFRVLRDGWVEAAPGLVVAGVDDLRALRRRPETPAAIDRALSGRPPGAAILLSHSPLFTERAAGAGAGLVLAGHTHDGQIWPFGFVTRRRYPLMAGRYDVNGATVIVGRGTGTWGPPMRLFRRGEIVRVVLRSAAEGARGRTAGKGRR